MKEKVFRYLVALVSFITAGLTYAIDAVYPGCPMPLQECVCDILPDTYNYGVMFGAVGCETKKVIFSGLIQTDYQFIVVDDRVPNIEDPSEVNNFLMRRVRFGVEADLGNNWKGVIVTDFAGKETQNVYIDSGTAVVGLASCGTDFDFMLLDAPIGTAENVITTTNNKHGIFGLYKAYIEKYCAGNFFRAGYRKVNFVREENIEDYDLKTIERSIATNFFNGDQLEHVASGSPLGFGERHVGLYLNGMYKNFGYGVALVNGFQGARACSDQFDNELGIFVDLYYLSNFNCMEIEIGVNAGYKPKGNNRTLRFNTISEVAPCPNPAVINTWGPRAG